MARAPRMMAALLGATMLMPLDAWAEDLTWAGATNTWESLANWGGVGIPNSTTANAQLGAAGNTTPTISTNIDVGSITFVAGAQPYTVTVSAGQLTFNGAGIVNNGAVTQSFSIGSGTSVTFLNGATSADARFTLNGSTLSYQNSSTAGTSSITANSGASVTVQDSATLASASVSLSGTSTLTLTGSGTGGTASVSMAASTNTIDISGTTTGASLGSIDGTGSIVLGGKQLTVGGNNGTTGFSGIVSGSGGSIVKEGTGTWTLTGGNTYTGGTTVNAGALKLDTGGSLASTGALTVNGGTFDLNGISQTVTALAGTGGAITLGSGTLTTNSSSTTTLAAAISGTGGLIKQGSGTLTLSGTNTYTGTTQVSAGKLIVSGSLTSDVTVDSGASFGGTGTITGNLTINGTIRPDIGTTSVVGTYAQGAGSTYQVEVTAGGQSDKINVTGSATINPTATVQVIADSGAYHRSTTYTILTASTGVTGTYASVSSNFAFLTPTLSYDANDVFLTLLSSSAMFQNGAQTPNQKSVGAALDSATATATGDYATVLNALSLLNTAQGPAALDAISGVNYAGFSTLSVQGANAFMTMFSQQAGHGQSGNQHVALALAADDSCDFSCETTSRWSAWLGGFGGLGTVAGDSNSRGSTYNIGGAAVGLDYKVDPRFTAGVTLGYAKSNLWTSGLSGQGSSDQVQVGLYGQFNQGALYVDGLAGYARGQNRMTRPIAIPGLAARLAQGSTSVDQFFGLVETGYKVELGGGANAFVTPFARLQGSTATQAAFAETGADSLDLNVQSQTTNSLRTVLGAQVGATLAKVDVKLQAGWSHELADTARPVTASFAGAPQFAFTTQGATAPRDGAVVGATIGTTVADHMDLFARYDGDFEGGTTSHTFFAGLRMTW